MSKPPRSPKAPLYQVGYGKPPTATRFRPGQSGNPSGRPKGAKNRPPAPGAYEQRLKEIMLEEAYRTVSVNDASGPTTIPMAQAVIRSLAVNAAKGNPRAQRLFAELLTATERENHRLNAEWFNIAITYKLEWERELERRQHLGLAGLAEPLPHPDHVIIDLRAGTAYIRGPATKEQKAEWDMWLERRQLFEIELIELTEALDDPSCPDRDNVLVEIAKTERVLANIRKVLGDGGVFG